MSDRLRTRSENKASRIRDIAYTEGVYNTPVISLVTTTNGEAKNGSIIVNIGKVGLVKSISIIVNGGACNFALSIKKSNIATALTPEVGSISMPLPSGNYTITLPYDTLLYEQGNIAATIVQSSATPCDVKVVAAMESFTSSLEMEAQFTYLALGNSIVWSNMGNDPSNVAFKGSALYSHRLKDQLRNDGIDIRLNNGGFGGSDSGSILEQVLSKRYDLIDFDLVTLQVGTNDSLGGLIPVADFKSNLIKILKYLYRLNPKATFVLLGDPLTDIPGRVTLPDYRAVLNTLGTIEKPYADMDISYFDLSTTFALAANPATDLNYTNAERVNQGRLHVSGAGHGLMKQGLYNHVKTLPWYANVPKRLKVINELT